MAPVRIGGQRKTMTMMMMMMMMTTMITTMMMFAALLAQIPLASAAYQTDSEAAYLEQRRQVVKLENSMRLGAQQTLDDKEKFLNERLMAWKQAEINASVWEGEPFPPELHFFQARDLMERSPVFQFIKQMPKGGILHVHFGATVTLDWFVKNVTHRPHCFVCRHDNGNGSPFFHFFQPPAPSQPECPWRLVEEERQQYITPEQYDKDLARNLSMVVDDPAARYPSIRAVWRRFEPYFMGMLPAVGYLPVFSSYLWRTMEEALEDGVQYLELRFTLELYDLEGTYSEETAVEVIQEMVHDFRQQHPEFIGVKIIIASIKGKSFEQQRDSILRTVRLRQKYPDDVLGFDLIQHEDTAPSLLRLLHVLRDPDTLDPPLPFFLHAGETVWTELTDENLVDAILLNTSRIGHAYAVLRHPWVSEQVLQRGIAIEISPISNQVLKLVSDLRNHPGAVLLSRGYPVVISSDDPAVWGAAPLSHDFYVTFMGLASALDDLRVLKQLAINSLQYSGLKGEEKTRAFTQWEEAYRQFVDRMYLQQNSQDSPPHLLPDPVPIGS